VSWSGDGRTVTVKAKDIAVKDSFTFGGPNEVAARVSFTVKWRMNTDHARSYEASHDRKSPQAFEGTFWDATATATMSGSESGFSFTSSGVSTRGPKGWAEVGAERNGVFVGN
jgi:hypothetical protein